MTLSNNQISVIGISCLLIIIFIVFVPIIAIDVDQPSSLAFCVTQPCEDMVVIQERKTILEFITDDENTQLLDRVNPDPSPDEVGFCTLQYDPYCGDDGVTYGNLCQLEQAGNVEIAFKGEC